MDFLSVDVFGGAELLCESFPGGCGFDAEVHVAGGVATPSCFECCLGECGDWVDGVLDGCFDGVG